MSRARSAHSGGQAVTPGPSAYGVEASQKPLRTSLSEAGDEMRRPVRGVS